MLKFDPNVFHYPSRRNLLYANKGMVGTASPLASQAGVEILKKGGNAIDAAIAAAATLTVVEPSGNGLGGDGFALIWFEGKLYGMNSSGPAAALMTLEKLKSRGRKDITKFGLDPVTVPGIPAGWAAMSERFGKLNLAECVEPAALYAENGFPVSSNVASLWDRYFKIYSNALNEYPILQTWIDHFCPNGKPLQAGDIFSSIDHANTLRAIGKSYAKDYYQGEIADKIAKFSQENGGFLRKEDLAAYKPEWVNPITTNYKGYDVWELPPNGIGVIPLMALNILENLELEGKDDVETYHKQIEALKLAFIDGIKHIGEPSHMQVTLEEMLSKQYAKHRSQLINEEALVPEPGEIAKSGTVYLATADQYGNMVSYIQSCYTGFGSGVVVPGTGIALHNRGCQFNLEEGHPNCVEPGKRPYHTIIPGFMTKDNKPIGPFGVMGGPLQPQAHLQVVSSLVDFHLNPQDALDKPRWQWIKEKLVQVEPHFPSHVVGALARKGHQIEVVSDTIMFGRGQIIIRNQDGVLIGGTEPRSDGYLAVW